jgi:hypothetical protein
MSKYDALTQFLNEHGPGEYLIDRLNDMLPGGLPQSAYENAAWWNNNDASHRHCRSWAAAGLNARQELARRMVRFEPLPKHRA